MKGFTLIEVLIAMFILIIGIGGAIAFITRTTSLTGDVSFRFEASYLAQEGIEIVRNLRDANFLAIRKDQCDEQTDIDCWKKNGLGSATTFVDDCALGCEVQYNNSALVSFADRSLNKDALGFYSYDAGEATPYKRKITITEKGGDPDILEVSVEVLWSKGSVKASTELYNWLEIPPPFRFDPLVDGQPAGVLPAGTTSAEIKLTTDINADCRYEEPVGAIDYDDMTNTFSTTGGTSHKKIVTGLADGTIYSYYVRCDALIGGKNFDDLVITFSIDV